MKLRTLLATLFALTLLVSGCGDDDDGGGEQTSGTTDASGTSAEGSRGEGGAVVKVEDSDLGQILVTRDGLTLYGFKSDTDGTPTCVDACSSTWPPFLVDEPPEAVEGVDDGVLSVVEHPDGDQLKAGDTPLYLYSGDGAAGDTNGQGVGGVWFVVAPDGTLIEDGAGGGDDGNGDSGGPSGSTEPSDDGY